jgi:hypothetical protein
LKFIKWSLVALFLGCVSAHAADLFVVEGETGSARHDQTLMQAVAPVEGQMPGSVDSVTETNKRPACAVIHRKTASPLKLAGAGAKVYWARLEAHIRIQQNALYAVRRAQQSGSFAASDSINHRYLTYG